MLHQNSGLSASFAVLAGRPHFFVLSSPAQREVCRIRILEPKIDQASWPKAQPKSDRTFRTHCKYNGTIARTSKT